MIFRMSVDIEADDYEMAMAKFDDAIDAGMDSEKFMVEENPFDETEQSTVLELARVALGDAKTFDNFADELDVSDDVLKGLQKKLEDKTNQ